MIWPIAGAIVVAIALVLAYFLWFRHRQPPPPPPPVAAEQPAAAPAAASTTATDDFQLPVLEASDAVVRQLAATLSSHPRLAAWLVNEDLVRRFTVAVTNLAEGITPRTHLAFMEPRQEFDVLQRGEAVVIDPRSYARFDTVVGVFESLDTAGVAQLFERFEPLMEEAYRDLGYPDGGFRATLLRAIRELLATPRLEGDPEVRAGVTSYTFADPRLEGLSGAQKQLLRMGPRNVARVQAKLSEIALALGFSPDQFRD